MNSKTYKINCPGCGREYETEVTSSHLSSCKCGAISFVEIDPDTGKVVVERTVLESSNLIPNKKGRGKQ